MKAVVVQFDQVGSQYERLLKTFIESWKVHGSIPLEVHRIDPPMVGPRHDSFYWNRKKLDRWVEALDGDTILVDCDMLCRADISDGFDQVEHIGIAERSGDIPLNGGLIFVRDTPEAHRFMEKWAEIDQEMLDDKDFHKPWHKKYYGMNQSSFGWLLENGYGHLLSWLPESYNLCGPWDGWEQAKMIHIKGNLRRRVLDGGNYHDIIEDIACLWESYSPP